MTIAHFYCAALSFLFGVFFNSFIFLTLPFLMALFLIAVALLVLYCYTKSEAAAPCFLWLSLALLFFSLGGIRVEWAYDKLNNTTLHPLVGTKVTREGVVLVEPVLGRNSTTLYVTLPDTVLLVKTDTYSEVKYGDAVSVNGTLAKPEDFQTDLGRTFAYTKYLSARGVIYQMDFAQVEIINSSGGNNLVRKLFIFKDKFLNNLYQVLPEPASGLAAGLVLGVKGALSDELEDTFRRSGIIHIVVLSGYNVMLVVLFVMFIMKRFLGKRPRLIFGLIAIALFALLVGLGATVVRASFMAGLLLLMDTLGRTYIILRGLLLAAVVMLLFNPLLLAFDIGFQLSFLATLGLILVAPWLDSKFDSIPNPYGTRGFLVATIATQIAVLPLLLFSIGEVSIVSILVNVLVLPLVPLAMLLTLLVGLVSFISNGLAVFFAYFAYLILMYIITLATWFAGLPFAAIAVPAFPWWVMLLIYALMLRWYLKKYSQIQVLGESTLLGDWTIDDETDLNQVTTSSLVTDSKTKAGESKKDSPATISIFFR